MHIHCAVRPCRVVPEGCGASFQARQSALRRWRFFELAYRCRAKLPARQPINHSIPITIHFIHILNLNLKRCAGLRKALRTV